MPHIPPCQQDNSWDFCDENDELRVPGSGGFNEGPGYVDFYNDAMAEAASQRQKGGLESPFLDINQISGGSQAAWEFAQQGEEQAGIMGMGPTQLDYGQQGIDSMAHFRVRPPRPRRAQPRGT